MDNAKAIKIILEISDECERAKKCNQCSFYNLVGHIEGCVFDKLVHEINPSDFRKALRK